MTTPSISQKQCKQCDKIKAISDFSFEGNRYRNKCKSCRNAYQKNRAKRLLPVLSPTLKSKQCTKCKKIKEAGDFQRRTKSANGLRPECKSCRSAYRKSIYRPRENRINILFRSYGLTEQAHAEMIERQNNRCAICGETPDKRSRHGVLHVDHCHKTGKVRELLCSPCNSAIALFQEKPEVLESAIQYLKRHR